MELWGNMPLEDFFGFDIRPYAEMRIFESGEAILREGERPRYLYFLTEGRAKLTLPHRNGHSSLINFAAAPCFLGEMELLGAQEAANAVTAVTRCRCVALDLLQCRSLLLEDAVFLRRMCRFLGEKALENTRHYSKNQAYPLENRLARFILLTASDGVYRERHTEAAEYLGVSYRHLLYTLSQFCSRGILQKTPQGCRLLDSEALAELSKELL